MPTPAKAHTVLAAHGARFVLEDVRDNPQGPVQEITSRHALGVDYEVVIGSATAGERARTVWSRSVQFGQSDRNVAGGADFVAAARAPHGLAQAGRQASPVVELPGGKLEPHESPETALVREWLEELDLAIKPTAYVATSYLEMEVSFHIDLFIVEQVDAQAEATALDHTELRWVSPLDAVQNLPCSPAFYLHWPHLRRWINHQ